MSTPTLTLPRPPSRKVLWSVLGVALVALLTLFLVRACAPETDCARGVARKSGGECVGVTDGSFAFPAVGDLSARIHDENREVEKSHERSVTLAYLESMSGGSEDRGPEGTRQSVTGALVAQQEINDERGTLPRVRLLLANTGRNDAYAAEVVDQLLRMKDEQHLVAVAGIGQSNARTLAAVEKLRAAGVPVVGATVAGDEMRSATPGFFRVSFPAGEQASAAARYFKQQQDRRPGYRLQVVKDNKAGDIYNASLYSGFMAAARRTGLKVETVVPFTSGAAPGSGNALRVVAEKICVPGATPDGVYFAARGRELRSFVEAAGENRRSCPVTVLSGSSAVGMYFGTSGRTETAGLDELGRRWKASGLRAYYTAYAHPDASARIYGGQERGPFPDFRRRYLALRGGSAGQLANGQAMVGHDAVYTAGIAARRAVDTYGLDKATASTVLDLLGQTNGTYKVRGVSGEIAFTPDTGEPSDRPMALVELGPPAARDDGGGRYRFVDTLKP
ncbi:MULTISPECIES: hypothetical protein [unclassified Streptomyces]|uniref:ABC transporter substrate-binding protein n=1 Tax=unclassified Streptomyces TaxID=2593676 RepID=UPI0033E94E3F